MYLITVLLTPICHARISTHLALHLLFTIHIQSRLFFAPTHVLSSPTFCILRMVCRVCPSQSTGCFCDVGGWCAAVSTGHHGHNLLSSTLLSSNTTDCPLSQVNQDQGLAQDISSNRRRVHRIQIFILPFCRL